MTISDTFYNLDSLLSTTEPMPSIRRQLIERAMTDDPNITLEPMTIVVHHYAGAGDLRYQWPNASSSKPQFNAGTDGLMSSCYKGRNTWRFFSEFMRPLADLALRDQTPCAHLLCVRFQPDGAKTIDLFPMCLISLADPDEDYGTFSKRFNNANKRGVYLDFCYEQNQLWLSNYD